MRYLLCLLTLAIATISRASIDATVTLLPKSWDHRSPLPVAIWLHGYGANPSRLITDAFYQEAADKLLIAVVGVPATREVGKDSFIWSDLPEFDLAQVEKSLAESHRVTGATFTRKALFGFSQGAVVAAELAARYPDEFDGAIVLSPGADVFPLEFDATKASSDQHYFISVGAQEAAGNTSLARRYRDLLVKLGAKVVYFEVPGMKKHDRPPGCPEKFASWNAIILRLNVPGA